MINKPSNNGLVLNLLMDFDGVNRDDKYFKIPTVVFVVVDSSVQYYMWSLSS